MKVSVVCKTLISSAVVFCISMATPVYGQVSSASKKNVLPEIGVVASDAISIDKEIVIGDALMRQLRGQAPLVNDPVLAEYIQDIGNRLVAQAENVKFPFEFFMINSPDINAFAFFGGHVGVHTGLIYSAENESELASVLAHEVSHVTQRHIARRIQSQQKSSSLQLASILGSVLLAIANPEAGVAAMSATNAAAQQSAINYTRSNEKEADRIGIQILAQSGYDPNASASFFAKLAEKFRLRTTPYAYLLTHPLPQSRIADARSRAAQFSPRHVPESLAFHLAKARIQARYFSNAQSNITYFQSAIDNNHFEFEQAAQYGLALSLMAAEQYQSALTIINQLLARDGENHFYLDTLSDLAIELNEFDMAISVLEQQIERSPQNQVITLNFANVLLKKKDTARATQLLKDYLLVDPENMLALQLLADAYGESRQMLEMHQSKAEVYALVAAYPRAIDELHSAYNFANDRQLEKQRIRARINQLRDAQDRLRSL